MPVPERTAVKEWGVRQHSQRACCGGIESGLVLIRGVAFVLCSIFSLRYPHSAVWVLRRERGGGRMGGELCVWWQPCFSLPPSFLPCTCCVLQVISFLNGKKVMPSRGSCSFLVFLHAPCFYIRPFSCSVRTVYVSTFYILQTHTVP